MRADLSTTLFIELSVKLEGGGKQSAIWISLRDSLILFSCQMFWFTFQYLGTVSVLLFIAEDTKTLASIPGRTWSGMKKAFNQEQGALEFSHISVPQACDLDQLLTVRPQFFHL